MNFHHLFGLQVRPASGVGRRVLRRAGFAAALFSIVTIFAARLSFAQTIALGGNRPPDAASLSARAAADRPLNVHIFFQLRNRKALSQLLSDLHDPTSPQYRHWLTPEQFNTRFGRTRTEVQAVTRWLSAHGFRVLRSSNREVLSAVTVAQAEEAFATTIAASPDGASYSNAAEPQIPTRFAGVIGSIEGLDNLRHWVPIAAPAPRLDPLSKLARTNSGKFIALPQRGRQAARAAIIEPAASSPAFQTGGFGPSDLWTFYDETPPVNGGTDGSGGDCIGVIEDSDYLDAAVAKFDSTFSLPTASVTRVFSDTSNPGTNNDELETLVDIEWAHAAAPGAPINAYIGNAASQTIDPLTDSILKAISDNACGAISISYVFCGSPPSYYTNTLGSALAQAATQGQSVFAASGDWGSAGLVLSGSQCVTASTPNVSELSADPYVTSVGGTQFQPTYNSQGNDVGNVAETAWSNSGATGGGESADFQKPAYQSSATPMDGMRDVPDVSLAASNSEPGFWYVEDSRGTAFAECCIGGTSISTPIWAGISKLIAQLGQGRLGSMNPRIYELGALGNVSESGLRDVVMGNNGYNGVPGFNAIVGYDQATGWGSPDVQVFESAFLSAAATPTPTATATATATATPTATATSTPTATATATPSATPTPRHNLRSTMGVGNNRRRLP